MLADSLTPLYFRPPVVAIEAVLVLALAGFWLWQHAVLAGRKGLPREKVLPDNIRRALNEMDEAARTGDGARFFSLARHALQETLAARWQTSAALITSGEVDVRLGRDGEALQIRRLFARADEVAYAGQAIRTEELTHWSELVHRQALGAPS